MSWKSKPPSVRLPRVSDLNKVINRTLEDNSDGLREALQAGTPVDTGALKASWEVSVKGRKLEAEPTEAYARYVKIDYGQANQETERIGDRMGQAINRLMGGRDA